MGYNLSGYLIKGNPDHILHDFSRAAGYILSNRREVTLSDAMEGYRDEDYLHFYASGQGIAIFHIDAIFNNRDINKEVSAGREVITFGLSEAAMAYTFEKHADKRSVWSDSVVFEDPIQRTGDYLPIKANTDVVREIFAPMSREFTGLDIISAGNDTRAWRFSVERVNVPQQTQQPQQAPAPKPAAAASTTAEEEAPKAKPAKAGGPKADLSRFPEIAKQFIKHMQAHKEEGMFYNEKSVWLYSFEAWLREKDEEPEAHIPLYCRVMQKATSGKPYHWLQQQTKAQKNLKLGIIVAVCAVVAAGLFVGALFGLKSMTLPGDVANAVWLKPAIAGASALITALIGFLVGRSGSTVSFKVHDKDSITEDEVLNKLPQPDEEPEAAAEQEEEE